MLVPWFITDWRTRRDPCTLSRFIEERWYQLKLVTDRDRQRERERQISGCHREGGPSIGRIGRKIKIWPRGWLVVFTEGLLLPQRQPCWPRACVCHAHLNRLNSHTGFDTVGGADRPYPAWILILHGRIHYRARIKDICILMDRAECIWRFIYAFRRVCATHPCLGGGECEKKNITLVLSIIAGRGGGGEGGYLYYLFHLRNARFFQDTFWISLTCVKVKFRSAKAKFKGSCITNRLGLI